MAKERKGDRHRNPAKPVQLRLPSIIRQQLEKLAEKNVSTMTAEVIIAIRKHLKDNDLWPPTTPD